MKEYNSKSLYNLAISNGHLDKEITYKEFSTVIRSFNKKIADEIVKGYVYKSPISKFEIKRRERKHRAIDWKESFACKEELISNGIVPYDKKEAPEGTKWFRYYIHNIDYVWKWTKQAAFGFWRFHASKPNKRKIGRLVKEKVDNDTIKEVNYEFL